MSVRDRSAAVKWAVTLECHAKALRDDLHDDTFAPGDYAHMRDLMEAIDQTATDLRDALGVESGFAVTENEEKATGNEVPK